MSLSNTGTEGPEGMIWPVPRTSRQESPAPPPPRGGGGPFDPVPRRAHRDHAKLLGQGRDDQVGVVTAGRARVQQN
jgi:hypothetical protein